MNKPLLFKISKASKGVDLRLYKAIRLSIIYKERSTNQWMKSSRERYKEAYESMREFIRKLICTHYPGYTHWYFEILGSNRWLDLLYHVNIKFLVSLETLSED